MSRSGDLLSLRPYCSFHGGLSPQALKISGYGYSGESLTALLVQHGAIACADLLDLREIGAGDLQPDT
jgi:hypothetical protein